MQDFSQSQMMDQGQMHNSGIDIPKRKDKEDLTESSEVCRAALLAPHPVASLLKKMCENVLLCFLSFPE